MRTRAPPPHTPTSNARTWRHRHVCTHRIPCVFLSSLHPCSVSMNRDKYNSCLWENIFFFYQKIYIYIYFTGRWKYCGIWVKVFLFFFFFTSCIVVSYRFLWYKFQKRDECIEDIKDRKLSIDSIYSSLFLIIRVRMNKNLLVITNIWKIYLFGTWVVSLEECFN